MQVKSLHVGSVATPDLAHLQLLRVLPVQVNIIHLQQQHIAAITVTGLQQAARCSVGLHRRHHLKEGIADAHDGIFQTKLSHTRILVILGQTQQGHQLGAHRGQCLCYQGNLS